MEHLTEGQGVARTKKRLASMNWVLVGLALGLAAAMLLVILFGNFSSNTGDGGQDLGNGIGAALMLVFITISLFPACGLTVLWQTFFGVYLTKKETVPATWLYVVGGIIKIICALALGFAAFCCMSLFDIIGFIWGLLLALLTIFTAIYLLVVFAFELKDRKARRWQEK